MLPTPWLFESAFRSRLNAADSTDDYGILTGLRHKVN